MIELGHVLGFIGAAIAIMTVLVVGTSAAAGLIPTPRRDRGHRHHHAV